MADHTSALARARNEDFQMPNARDSHPANLHMHGHADNYVGALSNGASDNYSQDNSNGNHADRLAEARRGGGW